MSLNDNNNDMSHDMPHGAEDNSLPKLHEMTPDEAIARLRSHGRLKDIIIRGTVRLTGEFPQGVKLDNCTIRRLQIGGVAITGELQVVGCQIRTFRFIEKSKLAGNVIIKSTKIGRLGMMKSTFESAFRLEESTVTDGLRIGRCEFHGQVRLWNTRFECWVDFLSCKFHGEADFRSFHANEGFVIQRSRFEDTFLMRGATVAKKFDLGSSYFAGLVDFSKAKFHDFAYMDRMEQGEEQRFAFENTIADRMLLRTEQLEGRLASVQAKRWEEAAQEYGMLKRNFETLHRYDDEDWAFYQFKVCQRRARARKSLNPFRRAMQLLDYVLLDLGCGYGTRPFRAVGSALVIMVICAIFFMVGIGCFDVSTPPIDGQPMESWANRTIYGFTTSVSVFTSGFSCEQLNNASGWVLLPLSIEALLGTLLWGLFIVAFSRKVIR